MADDKLMAALKTHSVDATAPRPTGVDGAASALLAAPADESLLGAVQSLEALATDPATPDGERMAALSALAAVRSNVAQAVAAIQTQRGAAATTQTLVAPESTTPASVTLAGAGVTPEGASIAGGMALSTGTENSVLIAAAGATPEAAGAVAVTAQQPDTIPFADKKIQEAAALEKLGLAQKTEGRGGVAA